MKFAGLVCHRGERVEILPYARVTRATKSAKTSQTKGAMTLPPPWLSAACLSSMIYAPAISVSEPRRAACARIPTRYMLNVAGV